MKKIAFIIFAGSVLFCSCEERFELHPENYSRMIRLECVADAGNDSVYIFPSLCIPTPVNSGDRSKTAPALELTELGIEFDGQFRRAVLTEYKELVTFPGEYDFQTDTWQPPYEEWVTRHRWAVPGTVPEGAVLKIKASAKGMGDVHGETSVPVKPKLSITCTPYEYSEGYGEYTWTSQYIKIKVDVTDKSNDTGYYALQVMQKTRDLVQYTDNAKAMGLEDHDDTYFRDITPESVNETAFEDFEGGSRISLGYDGYRLSYYYSGPIQVFRSDCIDGQELYFRVNPDYIYKNSDQYVKAETTTEFQARVFRISPEIYRYAKAYNLEGNELSEAGLAPVNFTYSNIIGGSGFFGAFTRSDSGWIGNPFVKEVSVERVYY